MKVKGVILFHKSAKGGLCFDVFAYEDIDREELALYDMEECPYVREYLKENPDIKYVGSEDLHHSDWYNIVVVKIIVELCKRGFEVVWRC